MTESKHTPGPWTARGCCVESGKRTIATSWPNPAADDGSMHANARLIAAAPAMLDALHEARRAIGDHSAPNDCYATGPLTGDPFRDLVQCPACSFIAMYDAVVAKAEAA